MKATTIIICLIFSCMLATHANAESSAKTTVDEKKLITLHYKRLGAKGKPASKPGVARCITDENTGLTWELKTDDGGIHDKDNNYRWGGRGAEAIGTIFFDDWNSLLDAANSEKLCGFHDWRVPTIDELKTLVVAGSEPTINIEYFPLTIASPYWSASAYTNYPEHGQTVHFGSGFSYYYNGFRGDRLPLRLVRGKP